MVQIWIFIILIAAAQGSKEYEKEYGSMSDSLLEEHFYLSKTKASYYEALQICHEKSMQLVSIEDSIKNKELATILKDSGGEELYWTSGNKISIGEWWWLKGEPIEYFNWQKPLGPSTYPFYTGRNENCIDIAKNGSEVYWNRASCDNKYFYICENLKRVEKENCRSNAELVQGDLVSNKRYYIVKDIITYSKALQVCRSMCMELVSIENKEKNDDVFQALTKKDANEVFWTSAYYKVSDNAWTWMNGETASFTSWNANEPNNARNDEYCIEVWAKDGTVVWNDQPCEEKRMFICEAYSS